MKKNWFKLLGIVTEDWAVDIYEDEEGEFIDLVKPLSEVEEGEEYSATVSVSAFWVAFRAVVLVLREDDFEEFVNPKDKL